jgi:hypothetical protein
MEHKEFDPNAPMRWYAFIVDGEVTWVQTVSLNLDYLNAVMSSDPKIIELPDELKGTNMYGWTYENGEFKEPQ